MKTQTVDILKFILLAYLFGFALQTVFYFTNQSIWLVGAMWAPTLAVLLTSRSARAQAVSSAKVFALKFFPLAFVIGASPYILVQIILWLSELGALDASQNLKRIPLVLILNPVATGLLGALGEEIGWRGYLQPALQKIMRPMTTYLIVGIVWAYWHIPANLAGVNGSEHRLINTFIIFPITLIFMSLAFGWLRDKSRSIWPGVYLHGVVNSVSNYWLIKANTEMTEKLLILGAWVGVGAIFTYIILQKKREEVRPN